MTSRQPQHFRTDAHNESPELSAAYEALSKLDVEIGDICDTEKTEHALATEENLRTYPD